MMTAPFSGIHARTLIPVFLLLLSVACKTGEKKKDEGEKEGRTEQQSDRAERGLKGKVSKLVQKKYEAKGSNGSVKKGRRVGPAFENYELRFNDAGMKTRELWFDSTGQVQREVKIEYDESGERQKNRVVSKGGEEPQSKTVWKYDDQGLISEKHMKTGKGKLKWKELYEYDSVGRKIRTVRKDRKGEKINELKIERNERGWVTEELHFTSAGSLQRRTKFVRDAEGRVARKTDYDDKGVEVGRFNYERNERGERTQVKKFSGGGALQHWREYSYNDKGELVKELHKKADGKVKDEFTYRYEYDEKGNWTRRVTLVNGEPYRVTERTYSYE